MAARQARRCAGRAAGAGGPRAAERSAPATEEARFRHIHQRVHAGHPACLRDEWLSAPCAGADGAAEPRPIVWSRRNGAWRRVEIVWVGAAPGNAGGKGGSEMGAHGTRIPFGGDIAGANLDVLLAEIGTDRNHTFLTAALNQLPARGGGEPTPAEIAAPVGEYATSVHLLRDTLLAAGPRLVVALGNVGLRATIAAAGPLRGRLRLPGLARLARAGLERGVAAPWPADPAPDPDFLAAWAAAWAGAPLPAVLWLTHPSAQNMSPYARVETAFHTRMREARQALRRAVADVLGRTPPAERAPPPTDGIYALPEWRERIGPRHADLERLWREKGV